jgi:ABC-2 type transport system permease protein
VLPLSFAVDAMRSLTFTAETADVWADLGVIAAFAVVCIGVGAATLRRRTA